MAGQEKKIALRVEQLSVNYDKTPVLWDIYCEIPEGKLVGIIGPNGAGKSTFLKALLGMARPLSGRIEFFGHPYKKIRNRIAYVPQRSSVDWDFPITAFEVVLMGSWACSNGQKLPIGRQQNVHWRWLGCSLLLTARSANYQVASSSASLLPEPCFRMPTST
jgi:ABC-type Mn2+/Zn2+ transport system ATPase subunit